MLEVATATESDIEALARLRHEWAGASGPLDAFVEAFGDWFRTESQRRVFWLGFHDEIAVGMVNLTIMERMPKPESDSGAWGYLSNMYVQGRYRNQGAGSQLIKALLSHADDLGLARVVLNPSDRSVPLYRRHGFAPAGDLLLRNRPADSTQAVRGFG